MSDVVVIGAGQAGAALVAKLRALGHPGGITLIGDEPSPPYQRPPLSKAYLLGEMEEERLWLRKPAFYAEAGIDLRLGAPVTAIDRAARTVTVGGATLGYGQLVLATGSVPRRLPETAGGGLGGVHVVRTLADVDAMRPEFGAGRRLVVIGGGYVGLEAAAVASKLGLEVTVVEMAPRILQRVAAPETSDWFRALHTGHGVKILEGVALDRLLGEGRVRAARLADGTEIPCDFVIAGVGILPATGLAEAAGLAVDNGIAVDGFGRTSDPAIWAAGDCTSFPWQGGRLRLESVQNAIDQGKAVAATILGKPKPYDAVPWFWSDQFDMKLQTTGLAFDVEEAVVRGDPDSLAFSVFLLRGGRVIAVDTLNKPADHMIGRRLVTAGTRLSAAEIADLSFDLKQAAADPARS